MSEAELAERAATTPERVRRLAELGILQPGDDGSFRQVDINRIRLAEALDASGLSLEHLGQAIASGQISLGFLDNLWPNPEAFLPTKTMGQIAEDHGLQWDLVESTHVRLGLSRPSREAPVREDEVLVFRASQVFLGVGLDEAAQIRFSRVMGENIRRLAEAQVHLFDRTVMGPMLESGLTEQQAWDISTQMSPHLTPLFEELLVWLYRRQQEHYLRQDIVEHLENAMDTIGLGRGRMVSPPAIAFLDLSGFTRLTEEQGDEVAAGLASSLAELVQDAANAHAGKPVKLLGDGVMFHFPKPADAVRCALEMVVDAPRSGLPPAHVGVDAGPVVFQDGDYFGRTVNVAARIAARAGPGQVLVSEAVVAAAEGDGLAFTEIGPAELKGVASPVTLHEAARSPGG